MILQSDPSLLHMLPNRHGCLFAPMLFLMSLAILKKIKYFYPPYITEKQYTNQLQLERSQVYHRLSHLYMYYSYPGDLGADF